MTNISTAKIGAGFERYVQKCLEHKGWSVVRIPDGARQLSPTQIIRVKSPFDFFASRLNQAIFFDAKTTQGESFPYSTINQDQVEKLLKIQNNDFVAGYIIHFRQVDKYCFVDAKTLSEVVPRASIKARACVDLGKELNIDILFAQSKEA
jgi:penicillin-binding protein-related factor A (putative recombinase)